MIRNYVIHQLLKMMEELKDHTDNYRVEDALHLADMITIELQKGLDKLGHEGSIGPVFGHTPTEQGFTPSSSATTPTNTARHIHPTRPTHHPHHPHPYG